MASSKPSHTPNLRINSPWGMGLLALLALLIVIFISGMPSDWRSDEGILGTNAPLMSDISILAYILLLVPMMLAGFVFARNKQFVPHHQVVMTSIVILNWGLIAFIMAASLNDVTSAEGLDTTKYRFLPLLHAAFGLAGQLIGSYLVARMWFEDSLPEGFKIKNIKLAMRITLACWLLAATLGVVTYVAWYGGESESSNEIAPQETPEVTPEAELTSEPEETPEATPEQTPES